MSFYAMLQFSLILRRSALFGCLICKQWYVEWLPAPVPFFACPRHQLIPHRVRRLVPSRLHELHSQSFRLFHVFNISVINILIFLLMYPGSVFTVQRIRLVFHRVL